MSNLILFCSGNHLIAHPKGEQKRRKRAKKEKKKKSEGKEVKPKTARAALAVGHLLQPLPQY